MTITLTHAQELTSKLINYYNKEKEKLEALVSQTTKDKLSPAEKAFYGEILGNVAIIERNLGNKLRNTFWNAFCLKLKFIEFAPIQYCSDFFITDEGSLDFNEENTSKVINYVFNLDKETTLNLLKEEMDKWEVGLQKQKKYRLVLNGLSPARTHFSEIDNFLFLLFRYLSNDNSEFLEWRMKCSDNSYTDLMLVFNDLIEVKLHKRGTISLEFSKKLNDALESSIINKDQFLNAA